MNNIKISVVIPVKNGERYLDSSLKAVFSQNINAEFEVIVIDSGSKDRSLDIMNRYPVSIYQIEEKDFNHALTRNLGISKAQGKYVVLMTQDAIPRNKRWMRELIDNLERDGQIAGVYSRQLPCKDSSSLARIRVNRFFSSQRKRRESQVNNIEDFKNLSPREKHTLCNFDNVSSCIRKSVWEAFPFSETEFGEDIEWAKRVLEAGYKIAYEPDSMVYHSHDFSILGWYKRNRINYSKLRTLFGINGIDNIYKLLIYFPAYSIRDFYHLCKHGARLKAILLNILIVPFYSFAEILGQYKGIRDSDASG